MQCRIIDIINEKVDKVVDNALLAQPIVRDEGDTEVSTREEMKRQCMMRFAINALKMKFGSPLEVVREEDVNKFLIGDVMRQYRDFIGRSWYIPESRQGRASRCRVVRTDYPYEELALYSSFVEAEKEWLKAIHEFEVAENKLRSIKEGKEWLDAEFKEAQAFERYNILKEILMHRGVIDGDRIRCVNYGERRYGDVLVDMHEKELDKDGLPLSMCKDISFGEGRVKLTIKQETVDKGALLDEFILAKDHYEKAREATLDVIGKIKDTPEYEQYTIAFQRLDAATQEYDRLWVKVLCKWRGRYVEDI